MACTPHRVCTRLFGSGAVVAPPYTTTSTNVTFYFNATATDQASAEAACALSGGHLAAYTSAQEQNEVEQYYISLGYILPSFHKGYWTGLQVRMAGLLRLFVYTL
jgi:hypothetical protein